MYVQVNEIGKLSKSGYLRSVKRVLFILLLFHDDIFDGFFILLELKDTKKRTTINQQGRLYVFHIPKRSFHMSFVPFFDL